MKGADAAKVAAWIVRDFPVAPSLASDLPHLLRHLIDNETLDGRLVEDVHDEHAKPELAAVGLAGFLGRECVEAYLSDPFPHLELVLLDRARRPGAGPTFLCYAEIADANAGEGVTLFPLLWLQRRNDPADPEARELLAVSQRTCLHVFRGYRLIGILKEAAAERAAAFIGGGFRQQHVLRAGTPLGFMRQKLSKDHIVFLAQKSDFENGWPAAALAPLFFFQPPQCAFTRAEQTVLSLAEEEGLTDAEIANELGTSTNSIVLRWRSIYARLADRVPAALLRDAARRSAPLARGTEKRRLAIAFARQHPEELRPYSRSLQRGISPREDRPSVATPSGAAVPRSHPARRAGR
jgi:hypothetical protein